MKFMSKLLMTLGVLIILFALNMSVSIDGANIVNLNLVSDRQNYIIIGCVAFISGIILFAASGNRATQSNYPVFKRQESNFKSKGRIAEMWVSQDKGGKLILISSIFAIFCLMPYWQYVELIGENDNSHYITRDYIGVKNFIVVIFIWAYPIKAVFQKSIANLRLMGICATLSIVWVVFVFYGFYQFNAFASQKGLAIEFLPKMGLGMILAAIASVFFATGVVVKKFSFKKY